MRGCLSKNSADFKFTQLNGTAFAIIKTNFIHTYVNV